MLNTLRTVCLRVNNFCNSLCSHFVEVYTYVRSPYQDLFVYDTVVQYDDPPERDVRWRRLPSLHRSPSHHEVFHSPRERSPSRHHRGRSHSRPRHRSPSMSWSPSGREYASTRRSPSPPHRARTRDKGKRKERRSASPPSRRLTPSTPPAPRHSKEPSPEFEPEPSLPPLPPRAPRPPRSALEAMHAHLGLSKGKAKAVPQTDDVPAISDSDSTIPVPPTSPTPSPLPQPSAASSRQDDLKARLQALKVETSKIMVERQMRGSDGESKAREKQLKLRARLAAEKRKCVVGPVRD